MANGKISVHTENLLPIIKKWLYSDTDIFLRELISNAQDAIVKLKKLVSLGEASNEDEYKIYVELDKENSVIKITDNGIGMTYDEVEKYINQVAFSGAEEFLKKYEEEQNDADRIIGHFGLGFYSAFMAASKVEIDTLSYLDGASPVHWVSDGGTEYSIDDGLKDSRGTTITLHISEDSKDYLDYFKLRSTIQKYCAFLPVEIYIKDLANKEENDLKPINNTSPLWLKNPSECSEEDYKSFYHEVFYDVNEPLFWIHLNVDFPFNLKGILYFPKLNHEFQTLEGQIKLYNNQVFIADNIKEVIPEYLMLLKGVIDCPDLPLNVSRSFLQNDGYVAKVSNHIIKKVADKLNGIFKAEKENYEKYWDDINPFIKYGCMRDDKFYDRVKDIILFKRLDESYISLKDIIDSDKNEIYYVTDKEAQSQYIEFLKDVDDNPLILDNMIDSHFSSFLEYKISEVKFKRVDSYISENLKSESDNHDENFESEIKSLFSKYEDENFIKVEFLKNDNISAVYVLDEEARRLEEIKKLYGGMNFPDVPKARETLVINSGNSLIKKAVSIKDDDLKNLICANIVDMAKLSHNTLTGDDKKAFLNRNLEMINRLTSDI